MLFLGVLFGFFLLVAIAERQDEDLSSFVTVSRPLKMSPYIYHFLSEFLMP